MLELILTAINAKLAMLNKLANLYCLAERRPIDGGKTVPYAYRGGRDLQPINIDSGSVGYWRINGEGSDEYINDPYVAGQQRQVTWPLRFYAMAHRDSQFTASALADLIGSTITDADDDVAQLLDMEDVTITVSGRDLDTTALYASEFDEFDLPYHLAFIALTVTVTIRGAANCFPDPCDIDTDILHSFNFCDAATRARLTDEQVDCLTAALCETPEPCADATITINGAAYGTVPSGGTENIIVESENNNPLGSLVGGNWEVGNAHLRVNGTTVGNLEPEQWHDHYATINGTQAGSWHNPSQTWRMNVLQGGSPVGSLSGTDWVVPPCTDATAVLKNTANTTISTTSIASGASQNITAPDATAVLKNTANTTISTTSIASGASQNITAPDATAVLKNTANTTLLTEAIPSNVSENITAPDGTYLHRDSAGNSIGSGSIMSGQIGVIIIAPDGSYSLRDTASNVLATGNIRSNQTGVVITAPDGTYSLRNTAGTVLGTGSIRSGQLSVVITAPDATITLNGSAYGSAPSGTTLNVVSPSLSLSSTTASPAYGASFTVTATATGFTPTSYSFGFPSDSVGGYSCTTQAGNSLAITAKGYSTQKIYVTATDGSTTVGAMLTVTVAQMTQVTDFLTNTGIIDATITGAVRTLALRLDDFGIWSKMRALYPFVGGTATTHKYNLKDPRDLDAAYRMVFSGGWTHNSNGITGNGTNTSGDSKLANTVPGQNSLNMGVYNRTAGTGGVEWSGSSSPRTWLAGNISGTAYFDINNSASTATTTAPADVRGTLMANRTDSASTELNLNAQGQRTTAAASSAPTATNFILGQFSGGGFNTARNYAAAWIADGLTPLEEANLRTVMQAFQTTLSRQV